MLQSKSSLLLLVVVGVVRSKVKGQMVEANKNIIEWWKKQLWPVFWHVIL